VANGRVAIIALLVMITYSNTLGVPFQWDEADFLVKNAFIRDIQLMGFSTPSTSEARGASPLRASLRSVLPSVQDSKQ